MRENGAPETDKSLLPQTIEATALGSITRAEVDMQVATAKQYPRSIERFQKEAMSMATETVEIAESCFYVFVRGGKTIEGPGIRLAEIVASCWGNLRAETRVIEEATKDVTAQAMAWDIERNVAIRTEIKRRITKKGGSRYSDDMIAVTANAAASIALRNAVFKVVPRSYVDPIYKACQELAAGDIKSLAQTRSDAMGYFRKFGVTDEQILRVLGKEGVADIGLRDVVKLKGIATAIKEKQTTIDEAFGPKFDMEKDGMHHFGRQKPVPVEDVTPPPATGEEREGSRVAPGSANPPSQHAAPGGEEAQDVPEPPESVKPKEPRTVSSLRGTAPGAAPIPRKELVAKIMDTIEDQHLDMEGMVEPLMKHKYGTTNSADLSIGQLEQLLDLLTPAPVNEDEREF